MTDPSSNDPEKKIIIDEDWKARVEAEKEAEQEPASAEAASADAETAQPDVPLAPPTLDFVVSSFAMQAMIALGYMPNPMTGKVEVRPNQAKHAIDTIAVLQQKTEGNRTADETAMIDHLLHELRMGYVSVAEKAKS